MFHGHGAIPNKLAAYTGAVGLLITPIIPAKIQPLEFRKGSPGAFVGQAALRLWRLCLISGTVSVVERMKWIKAHGELLSAVCRSDRRLIAYLFVHPWGFWRVSRRNSDALNRCISLHK